MNALSNLRVIALSLRRRNMSSLGDFTDPLKLVYNPHNKTTAAQQTARTPYADQSAQRMAPAHQS